MYVFLSSVWLFAIPWNVASRLLNSGKNTGVGCHFLLQGIFPDPGKEPSSFVSLALAGRFFTSCTTWKPRKPAQGVRCAWLGCRWPAVAAAHRVRWGEVIPWEAHWPAWITGRLVPCRPWPGSQGAGLGTLACAVTAGQCVLYCYGNDIIWPSRWAKEWRKLKNASARDLQIVHARSPRQWSDHVGKERANYSGRRSMRQESKTSKPVT